MIFKFRTTIFTTNFVGSLDNRASREVFPIEDRSPEIADFDINYHLKDFETHTSQIP